MRNGKKRRGEGRKRKEGVWRGSVGGATLKVHMEEWEG
jgi:hypothetical protein